MVRILHTSDIQLDAPFGFLGEKGSSHRQQLRETFGRIVDLAAGDGYHLLLIAGNLFNNNWPAQDTINFVREGLGDLAIPVCILPGNHDYLDDNSVYRKHAFPDNVHILSDQPSSLVFPELELAIAGYPLRSRHEDLRPLKELVWPEGYRWHIAMAYGNLQIAGSSENQPRPIWPREIRSCGADYVVLGSWHSFADYSQGVIRAIYSGAPEPTALDHNGTGQVAGATLTERSVEVEALQVGSVQVKQMTLNVDGLDKAAILERIHREADPRLMFSLTLEGSKSLEQLIEAEALRESAAADFYFLEIVDRTDIDLDSLDPAAYPENQVIGQYVRTLHGKITDAGNEKERAIAEQALQLGVALLQGQEVLR